MAFSIKYSTLFKVNVFHQFFLNKGFDEFAAMTKTEKAKQLDTYNVTDLFNILPTGKTRQQLNGHNLVFKFVNSGFTVWTKLVENKNSTPFISLENDLNFTFLIKIKDSEFNNYTNLKLENAGKLYYFSNRRLNAEPGTFPLINESGENNNIDETFVLSDVSANTILDNLSANEKDNLFGLIRIFMKGDETTLNVTDFLGKIPEPHKTFELLFDNRETVWRYIFDNNQTVLPGDDVRVENADLKILVTKSEQPLTQKGFVSVELGGVELPNPNTRLVKPNTSNNKIYSEIYM